MQDQALQRQHHQERDHEDDPARELVEEPFDACGAVVVRGDAGAGDPQPVGENGHRDRRQAR